MSNIDFDGLDKTKIDDIDWENLDKATIMARDKENGYGTAIKTGFFGALGNAIGSMQKTTRAYAKPAYMSDEEWNAKQTGATKWIDDQAQTLENNNRVQFDPWSGKSIAQGVAGVGPYAAVLVPASLMAMRSGNANAMSAAGMGLASKAGLGAKGIEIAGALAPALGMGAIGSFPEAAMEGQSAYEEAISEGKSTEEATRIKNVTTALNVALLTGTNAIELATMFGNVKSLLPKGAYKKVAAKLGGMFVTEGFEEGAQEVIPQKVAGKDVDWDRVGQSAVVGGTAGVVLGGLGMGANRLLDKAAAKNMQTHNTSSTQPQSAETNLGATESTVNSDPVNPANGNDIVSNMAAQEGTPYVLGGDGSYENGTDCGQACKVALNKSGIDWNSRYVPEMIKEGKDKGIWHDANSGYVPQAGDLIVVDGEEHVVMADGNGGIWQAGSSEKKVYHSKTSAEEMFDGKITGYIATGSQAKGNGSNAAPAFTDYKQAYDFLDGKIGTFDDPVANNELADLLKTGNDQAVIAKANENQTNFDTNNESIPVQNHRMDTISNIVSRARERQAANNQKALDYNWYMAEHERAARSRDADTTANVALANKAINNKGENAKLISIVDRALNGDKGARKNFESMKPTVRRALLEQKAMQLQLENERVNRLQYDDIAVKPFVPNTYASTVQQLPQAPQSFQGQPLNGFDAMIQSKAQNMANKLSGVNKADVKAYEQERSGSLNLLSKNKALIDMTKRAMSGNASALKTFSKLRPDAKEALINLANGGQPLNNTNNVEVKADEKEQGGKETTQDNNQNSESRQDETSRAKNKNEVGENKKSANGGGYVVVTGDEFGEYADIKELRVKAIQYYANNLQGTSVENKLVGKIDIDENGIVGFTGSGKNKMQHNSAKEHKLLLVKHLPALIEGATNVTEKDATSDKHMGEHFYYLHTGAKINNEIIPIDITLVKRNNGEIHYYNHLLPSEERNKIDTSVYTEPESSKEALGTPPGDVSVDINISQPAENVNAQIGAPKKALESKPNEKQQRFDTTRAKSKMDKLFAKKDPVSDKKFVNIFDESKESELEARIKNRLNKLSANPFFDPDLMLDLFEYGGIKLQKGLNTFAKWSEGMINAFGETSKPFLKSVWSSLNAYPDNVKFDSEKMGAVFEYVGGMADSGKNISEIKKMLMDEYDDAELVSYVDSAYKGIVDYPTEIADNVNKESKNKQGVKENVVDGAEGLAEGISQGDNQNPMGGHDESGEPAGGNGQGLQSPKTEVQPQNGLRVSDSGTASGGKASNSGVQSDKSEDRAGSTGSSELSGSVVDSYSGSNELDRGRGSRRTSSSENGRNNESNTLTTEEKESQKAGALDESIERDLPMLLPEQRTDVALTEAAFKNNTESTGIMVTNGTGTGKTFSGLGVAKRFVNSGKKNILEDTNDMGKGVTITTYANLGTNNELAKREWDLIIADESQNLMSDKNGSPTNYLESLRALTYHDRGLYNRFKMLNTKEYAAIAKLQGQKELTGDEKRQLDRMLNDIATKQKLAFEEWEQIGNDKRPKVMFLSATPFSWDKDIDYAEGYLFNYDKVDSSSYNSGGGFERFMMKHFGYSMRYNKLTRPDAKVDNRSMEVLFHNWLRKIGVLIGRMLKIDKDYDRGFIVTPNAVGSLIDKGFEVVRTDKSFEDLAKYYQEHFSKRDKNYLLEYIKAKEAIPIIEEYVKAGKKVVVFHQSMKEQDVKNPFVIAKEKLEVDPEMSKLLEYDPQKIAEQYAAFQKIMPELFDERLGLQSLLSPVNSVSQAFGDKAVFFNGRMSAKDKEASKKDFNDDNGTAKVILVQQDAGNAGISLHDVTGKYPRVLINLAIPSRPTYAMQIEGRIYRHGTQSNAIFRYLTTGTDLEKELFSSTVGQRAGTAENLAMGDAARGLVESFRDLYLETMDGSWERRKPGHELEGTGGKEMDTAAESGISDWDRAKSFYYGQQKKTSKTKAQEGVDYFATPEPVGLKMVEWAGLHDGDKVLEPSAGHGAISRWFSPNTENTIIEPSGKLAPTAQMLTAEAKLIKDNFENHYIGNKYDAVVMNPPYGSGGKMAMDHLAKAFGHLKNNGRVIAIVPQGPSMQKRLDDWYESKDAKEAVKIAEIKLPSSAFKRAGTSVHTKIVVFDRIANIEKAQQMEAEQREIDLSDAKDVEELFDRIENMTIPQRLQAGYTLTQASDENKAAVGTKAIEAGASGRALESTHFVKGIRAIPNDPENKYFVLRPKKRVERSTYDAINKIAKKNGGFYSRSNGSFDFKTEAAAESFIKETSAILDEAMEGYVANEDRIFTAEENPFKDVVEFKIRGNELRLNTLTGRVTGDTFQVKKELGKSFGGRWDAEDKAWYIKDPEKMKRMLFLYADDYLNDKVDPNTKFKIRQAQGNIQRSIDELQSEVKKAFPTAKVKLDGNALFVDMPNGKQIIVDMVNKIVLTGKQAEKARKDHGYEPGVEITIEGSFQTLDGKKVMTIAQNSQTGTVFHEAMHAAMDMALTDRENAALLDYANKHRGKEDAYEFIADMYKHWVAEREKGRGTIFGKLFQKIKDLINDLKAVFGRMDEIEKIMRDVESGEVWERKDDKGVTEAMSAEEKLQADEKAWADLVDLYDQSDKDEWKKDNDGKLYDVMKTPLVLTFAGAKVLPVQIYGSGFKHIVRPEHPGMDLNLVKQLPRALADPMLLAENPSAKGDPNRFVVLLDLKDNNGATIMVPFELNLINSKGGYMVNRIATAYGVNYINNKSLANNQYIVDTFLDDSKRKVKVFYANKNKITSWAIPLNGTNYSAAIAQTSNLFDGSIPTEANLVKLKNGNPTMYSPVNTNKVDIVQTRDDLLQEMKRAFPTAKVHSFSNFENEILDNMGVTKDDFYFQMPNGHFLIFNVLREKIIIPAGEDHKTKHDWGIDKNSEIEIGGFYKLIGGEISQISIAPPSNLGTSFHEAFHAAMQLVLTNQEKKALLDYANKHNNSNANNEEWLAEQYRYWVQYKQDVSGTKFDKLWKKIFFFAGDMIRKVLPAFNKHVVAFKAIESGEVWERELNSRTNDSNISYKVTNNKITGDTLIPIVDVTGQSKVNVNSNAEKVAIAKSLIGKTFRIIGSDGIGRVASVGDGKHLINSSNVKRRNSSDRRTALSAIEDILNNAIYVEKHSDIKHGSDTHYIELYAATRNGENITRFRIVAKEGDKTAGEYEVKDAKFYDIIKDGKLHANTLESVLPAIIPNGMKGQVMGNSPSTAIRVADLLKGVKDRDGNFYVNDDDTLNYENPEKYSAKQEISSAGTSLMQIPAVFKKIKWVPGTVNIDIGGGKYDLATKYAKEQGVENIVFDPFNRNAEHNKASFEKIKAKGDTATVANVLNVIAEEQWRDNVILQAAKAIKENGTAYFAIYEGNGTGEGQVTSKGWQNNKKTSEYISEIEKHFDDVRRKGNIIEAMRPNLKSGETAVWSMGEGATSDIRYSIRAATENLIEKIKNDKNLKDKIEVRDNRKTDGLGVVRQYAGSPGYIAERIPQFKLFFEFADKAMQTQEEIRSKYQRILKKVYSIAADKESQESLHSLLWSGDAKGKEYTAAELKEEGCADNVIDAYRMVRAAIKSAYKRLNEARKQVRTRQKNMGADELKVLRNNKFASDIVATRRATNGLVDEYIVSWREAKNWAKSETMTEEVLADLRNQDHIQVLKADRTSDGNYDVEYREGIRDINEREGYIPHFFHDFFIMEKQLEKDPVSGAEVEKLIVVGSGRNLNDATKKAEAYLKKPENENKNIVIQPKTFSFDGENENIRAAVVGDSEYTTITKRISAEMEMSVAEAREFLSGKAGVQIKGRHRFFGNMLQRKGAEGFEQDMPWVLNHFFNSVGRYVALEEFKPKAIGTFERYHGRFDNDYSNQPVANYTKHFINDVNGNPTAAETTINNLLNSLDWWKKHVVSNYGDRAALQLAGNVTGEVSLLKIGYWNISSALLNLSQILNVVGITGDMAAVKGAIGRAVQPTMSDKAIFVRTGIMNDITMDTTSGYGKFNPGKHRGKTMYLFRKMDLYSRKVAVLAGYHAGRKKGMSDKEAIAYARVVNRKANFDYSVVDTPHFIRASGPLGQIAFQFKKYPLKELELMYEIASKGNLGQNVKFWGGYFLLCGLLQFPGADWLDKLLTDWFGFSPKKEAKSAIFKSVGNDPVAKELAKIAIYGLGATANMDISRRAGIGDVSPTIENGWTGLLGGPTASTIYQTAQGLAKLIQTGDPLPTIKALSHTLGNYYAAATGHAEDKRGRTTGVYDTMYDRLLKASGFRSLDESIAADKKQIYNYEKNKQSDAKTALIDKMIRKKDAGEKRTDADMAEMRRLGVNNKLIDKEIARRRMSPNDRVKAGMSKDDRKGYSSMLDF